jgi:hypothetical protein
VVVVLRLEQSAGLVVLAVAALADLMVIQQELRLALEQMDNLELAAVEAVVPVIHQPVVMVALALSSSSAINKVNNELSWSNNY